MLANIALVSDEEIDIFYLLEDIQEVRIDKIKKL